MSVYVEGTGWEKQKPQPKIGMVQVQPQANPGLEQGLSAHLGFVPMLESEILQSYRNLNSSLI